ncbi:MAG: hypothetical protein ABH830_04140 [Patescibacteria group bacterium]
MSGYKEPYKIFSEDKIDKMTNEQVANGLIKNFEAIKTEIGKRKKSIYSKNKGALPPERSVKLYLYAIDLYALGFFEVSIILSRAIVEYIVYEIFKRFITKGDENEFGKEQINFISDNIDFRKIVNTFFYPKKIITKDEMNIFNKIYDIGNKYIHPKSDNSDPMKDAEQTMHFLSNLLNSKNIRGFIGGFL